MKKGKRLLVLSLLLILPFLFSFKLKASEETEITLYVTYADNQYNIEDLAVDNLVAYIEEFGEEDLDAELIILEAYSGVHSVTLELPTAYPDEAIYVKLKNSVGIYETQFRIHVYDIVVLDNRLFKESSDIYLGTHYVTFSLTSDLSGGGTTVVPPAVNSTLVKNIIIAIIITLATITIGYYVYDKFKPTKKRK